MKSLVLALIVFSISQYAKADQLVCSDSGQNVRVYVKSAIILNSDIVLTLSDDHVIRGTLTVSDAGFTLDERTSATINLQVTVASRNGQNMLLISPLMSMEIPQILACEQQ